MSENPPPDEDGDCVVHVHPVPPEELRRYSPARDPYSEQDVANYVQGQAPDEVVQHVERVRRDVVLGEAYEIWDVTTDTERWWVISNMTNLYSQRHFPSLDYTLSFHIGLMTRLRSRSGGADHSDPSPFDDVFRRMDQADERHERALENEEFQAVGMQLREALISLVGALRRRVPVDAMEDFPKEADVVAWLELLCDALCPGNSKKAVRRHLKCKSKSTWQLVNWLTHARNAERSASLIALQACHGIIGDSIVLLERSRTDDVQQCPRCASKQIRTHFDLMIGEDGDYFLSCAACGWDDHPNEA